MNLLGMNIPGNVNVQKLQVQSEENLHAITQIFLQVLEINYRQCHKTFYTLWGMQEDRRASLTEIIIIYDQFVSPFYSNP
jgi:hypothetical protein